MPPFKLSKLFQFIGFSVFSTLVIANEQPSADSLVGESYIGLHGAAYRVDNSRLFTTDNNSSLDSASGVGVEFGYRVSPLFEARLSATKLNIDTQKTGYDVPSGSGVALDLLYFPYKSNLYTIAGANFLDLGQSNLSGNIGAGYRHYVSNSSALYIEGKGHYQFDDNYKDFSAQVGFIYYFDKKPASIKHTKQIKTNSMSSSSNASVALKDSDKDGISDNKDKCANSPIQYKVNDDGCTVYMKRKQTMELLVNFDNDKSDVKPDAIKEIAKVAEFMSNYRQTQLTINGHTSSQGDSNYNQNLSEKRAQAIVNILVNDFSIAKNRLTALGHGEEQLINDANNAEAHAQNRRIEATIIGAKKVPVKR